VDSHGLAPEERAREEGQNDIVLLLNAAKGSKKSGMSDFTRLSEIITLLHYPAAIL
jgi:hypothetical protein